MADDQAAQQEAQRAEQARQQEQQRQEQRRQQEADRRRADDDAMRNSNG